MGIVSQDIKDFPIDGSDQAKVIPIAKSPYGKYSEEEIKANVNGNLSTFDRDRYEHIIRTLPKRFQHDKTPLMAVMRARDLADEINRMLGPKIACRTGCNFCCHQAVTVLSTEAEIISRKYKLPMNPGFSELDREEQISKSNGVPCPLLKDGKCSVYEDRPLSCRLQWNTSSFPELCDVVSNQDTHIPNVDTSSIVNYVVRTVMSFNNKRAAKAKKQVRTSPFDVVKGTISLGDVRDFFNKS